MGFSIGICGLTNVGKSTLFKVLTKREVEISPRKFTTLHPNVGQISVEDERLNILSELVKPEKKTPVKIEFYDIAGLIKGAHQGVGLGNQFLAEIRQVDGILFVLRAFEAKDVENVLGKIDPKEELEVLKTEFLMKDLETVENLILKFEKKEKKRAALLKKIKEEVAKGRLISEIELSPSETKEISQFQFLTQKPFFCLVNWDGKTNFSAPKENHLVANLKEEEEFLELEPKEREELGFVSQTKKIIENCFSILNLVTFFTIAGGKEVRAWEVKKGSLILEGARKVHSDFEKKFKRAEVINFSEFVKVRDWKLAKENGKISIVGKDYVLQDGDIVEFKI